METLFPYKFVKIRLGGSLAIIGTQVVIRLFVGDNVMLINRKSRMKTSHSSSKIKPKEVYLHQIAL